MSKIISTGSYLPRHVMGNDELVEKTGIESSDDWISKRTGIRQRHFAGEDESLAYLASQAAKQTIESYGKDIYNQINLIIVASMSSKLPTPSIASQVQRELGIEECWAFDLSGACSGFIMALDVAESLGHRYQEGYSLVIGAERMSDIIDFSDRSTSILFGDGAGAVLIKNDGQGLCEYASDLSGVPDTSDSITVDIADGEPAHIAMSGREVFNFVVRRIIPSLSTFIKEKVGEMDYLVSHQANARLVDIMVDKLEIDHDKAPLNIQKVANTSAGSVPILLDELVREGKLRLNEEQKVVLTGFGGGLSWGHLTFKI